LKTSDVVELKELPSFSTSVAAFSLALEEGGFEYGTSSD
jgi:hypothetical protein